MKAALLALALTGCAAGDLAVGVANLPDLALAAVEQVVRRVLFGAEVGEDVGPAIRGWLRLFPLRLLGLPVGGRHLKRLNRALAALPRPAWMPSDLRPEEVRDQLATLYVAAVATTASDVTWTLLGTRDALPIWFVPRQHRDTGESAIVLLGEGSKFGAGPRKCLGEQLAGFVGEATCHLLTERMSWAPHRLDLRPKLGLTRWPRRALVRRVA